MGFFGYLETLLLTSNLFIIGVVAAYAAIVIVSVAIMVIVFQRHKHYYLDFVVIMHLNKYPR
jgi:NADH:ubiquinone oxidoreductase subunit K